MDRQQREAIEYPRVHGHIWIRLKETSKRSLVESAGGCPIYTRTVAFFFFDQHSSVLWNHEEVCGTCTSELFCMTACESAILKLSEDKVLTDSTI